MTSVEVAPPMGGVKKLPQLPARTHPHARLGKADDLNVQGSASNFVGVGSPTPRQYTHITLNTVGSQHLTINRAKTDLPPLLRQEMSPHSSRSSMRRRMHYSYQSEDILEKLRGPKFGKGPNDSVSLHFGPGELEVMIREKLSTGLHGLKQLFRANDPSGHGNVSREALQRILHSLVGYVPADNFQKLLRRINLDDKQTVSFDDFVGCFKDQEPADAEWICPVSGLGPVSASAPAPLLSRATALERHLRATNLFVQPHGVTPTHALVLLRNLARSSNGTAIRALLPPKCLEPEGVVLKPHLREMLVKAGIPMTHIDFDKLWNRFDLTNSGNIFTKALLKALGVDSTAPRPPALPVAPPPKGQDLSPAGMLTPRTPPPENPAVPVKEEEEERPSKKVVRPVRQLRHQLDSVVDSLHYLFEEPHNSLLHTLRQFDTLGDGFISRVDFRYVINVFGFPVGAMETESFLSRIGIRVLKGQLNYHEFLTRFWARGEGSMVNRIVSNRFHMFQRELGPVGEEMAAEELEARLIDFFHRDFFKVLSCFRACDKYRLGVITQHELKKGIERVLGYGMTVKQWERLRLEETPLEQDGLVQYPAFLAQFNDQPGAWNRQDVQGVSVTKISNKYLPPDERLGRDLLASGEGRQQMAHMSAELERLAEEQKRKKIERKSILNPEKKPEEEPPKPETAPPAPLVEDKSTKEPEPDQGYEGRPLAELHTGIKDLLQKNFPIFDKHYKDIDRKHMGRINILQFGEVLFKCGVKMVSEEIKLVWRSFELSGDNMCSYRKIIHKFLSQIRLDPPHTGGEVGRKPEPTACEKGPVRIERGRTEVAPPLHRQSTVVDPERQKLLDKFKFEVISTWDSFKGAFKIVDPKGTGVIPKQEFKEIVTRFMLTVTDADITQVASFFDKDGSFDYVSFMESFTRAGAAARRGDLGRSLTLAELAPRKSLTFSTATHPLQAKQNSEWHGQSPPTIKVAIDYLAQQLVKEWKSLRRAFRKCDANGDGYLEISDFRRAMEGCGIVVCDEDLYHVLSEFDAGLGGRISYEEFLGRVMKGDVFREKTM